MANPYRDSLVGELETNKSVMNDVVSEQTPVFGSGASGYLESQFNRMEIPEDERAGMGQNIYDFARKSRFIESSDNPMAQPSTSTAKGYYQFTDPSVSTAFNRYRNTTGDSEWGGLNSNPQEWSEDESDMMFLANMFGQSGSDDYMKAVGGGDRDATKGAYSLYHHTDPDEATYKRMEQYF